MTHPTPSVLSTATSGPTRQNRQGDTQPLPTKNDLPYIHDLVIADITSRKTLGTERYGTPLQPRNGRSAIKDAYEEAVDLAVYLRQALWEEDHTAVASSSDEGKKN